MKRFSSSSSFAPPKPAPPVNSAAPGFLRFPVWQPCCSVLPPAALRNFARSRSQSVFHFAPLFIQASFVPITRLVNRILSDRSERPLLSLAVAAAAAGCSWKQYVADRASALLQQTTGHHAKRFGMMS